MGSRRLRVYVPYAGLRCLESEKVKIVGIRFPRKAGYLLSWHIQPYYLSHILDKCEMGSPVCEHLELCLYLERGISTKINSFGYDVSCES